MAIAIHLPSELEAQLRTRESDLDERAKEAMLIEFYRQDKLTHYQLSQALGLSRFETDELLRSHGVVEDLLSVDEFRRQVE